ncbi:MAG: hypothetical protein FD124_3964 [Alphaproteobacteria bacterium]|nr:MAG: hypothetical protein FD124_3964 [Alphaproteobacteria bacterium]
MISLAHSAPATLLEICVGTPASENSFSSSSLADDSPIDHQVAAAVMLDTARPAHFAGDVDDRRDDLAPEQRLQALGIVDAILQTEDDRRRVEVRRHLGCRVFGVGRFDAAEHELRSPYAAGVAAGLHGNVRLEELRVHEQAVAAYRRHMLRAPDQKHGMSGASQHAAVVAADRAGAHHCNFHRLFSRFPLN